MERREFTIKVVSPALFTLSLFVIWEAVCRLFQVPLTILPAASDVFAPDAEVALHVATLRQRPIDVLAQEMGVGVEPPLGLHEVQE